MRAIGERASRAYGCLDRKATATRSTITAVTSVVIAVSSASSDTTRLVGSAGITATSWTLPTCPPACERRLDLAASLEPF